MPAVIANRFQDIFAHALCDAGVRQSAAIEPLSRQFERTHCVMLASDRLLALAPVALTMPARSMQVLPFPLNSSWRFDRPLADPSLRCHGRPRSPKQVPQNVSKDTRG